MNEDQHCPDCGGDLTIHTKGEAGYCKYWFICIDHEECGWESHTFRGPNVDPNEHRVEKEGYDAVIEDARRKALEQAHTKTTDDFY